MFEIHVADTDVNSGTIPISWCTNKGLLKELEKHNVRDPQVVICVAPVQDYHVKKEYRKVVSLKDLMAYIEFRVPGGNNIYAFVSLASKRSTQNKYLAKEHGSYSTSILSYDGKGWADCEYLVDEDAEEEDKHRDVAPVVVPKGVFAKEPPAWEKRWVNHLFSTKPEDQCRYRRRRLFAYTVQPLLGALNMAVRLGALILCMLFGFRNLKNWREVFQPLTHSLSDTVESIWGGGTYFYRAEPASYKNRDVNAFGFVEGLAYLARRAWTLVFMPLLLIPLALLLTVYGVEHTLYVLSILLFAVVCLVAVLCIGALVTSKENRQDAWYWWCGLFEDDELWYVDASEVAHLVCDGEDKPRKVGKLPRKHRTIKLRFTELKSKVCRPFAG